MTDGKKRIAYRILDHIREAGEASPDEIYDQIGGTRDAMYRGIGQLKKSGLIYSYMFGIYRVTDKGKPPERQ